MSEAKPQRTSVRIGQRMVEVALFKTSGSMPEAQHETRRVDPDGELVDPKAEAPAAVLTTDEPLGPVRGRPAPPRRLTKQPAQYRHGVSRDGDFIDLTELLDAIDERNKLESAEIVKTVPNNTLPRLRIRGSYFVAPAEPDASPFLAHLWLGLRRTNSAAVLRWSKRTNQALGALVATYDGSHASGAPILVLLELEWQAAMRSAPPQAHLTDAAAEVSESGAEAVTEAMRELRSGPEVWAEMQDQRNAQRAELLDAARRGEKWALPEPEPDEASEHLGDAILAAVR